jgi:hypothetical protein
MDEKVKEIFERHSGDLHQLAMQPYLENDEGWQSTRDVRDLLSLLDEKERKIEELENKLIKVFGESVKMSNHYSARIKSLEEGIEKHKIKSYCQPIDYEYKTEELYKLIEGGGK